MASNKVGHGLLGVAYLLVGLWHLFNQTKLHASHPNSYTSRTWFPISKSRYLELFSIMVACTIYVTMMLFVSPDRHQPFDTDGTIPSYHLHTFEHTLIAMTFFTYAALAVLLDKIVRPDKAKHDLTQLLAAIAFAQQLLLLHFHSADHTGVEGQYHLMLQILTFVSLSVTLIGIGYPKSFLISFLRSSSIMFQGVWMIVLGYMVWTPGVTPKGCFMNLEDGHYVVRCHSDTALHRAKSLVNIMFSLFVIMITLFTITFYLIIVKRYSNNVEYRSLVDEVELEDGYGGDDDDVVETKRKDGESKNFLLTSIAQSVDMER